MKKPTNIFLVYLKVTFQSTIFHPQEAGNLKIMWAFRKTEMLALGLFLFNTVYHEIFKNKNLLGVFAG
jgi:hypothetical protein